ncbi:hypothetical protein [Bacteroides sp. ET225]|jgi:hypothetical protein|uniref:hypothetical protein n=1 Tax=Bacteroides sp. ET225 TaxID=2972461 RepID=UPI0021AD2D54|nr:hypothetical protein [Bacteroides sp. ET225]MCR8918387.1 hypothetical protein [Bacteroides sp. ET225]
MSDIKKVLDEIPSIKTDASVDVDKGYTDVHIELAKEQLREARLKNEALEEENRGDSQDRDQRKDFAERIYSFAAIYMFGVFVILFLSGTQTTNFKLSDNVLITLLGTTTANVIGILIIVVTYLFSRKKK